MTRYRFRIALSPSKLEQYYRGTVRHVIVTTDSGITLQIPISVLRSQISRDGLYGLFAIDVDDNNRLKHLERIGP